MKTICTKKKKKKIKSQSKLSIQKLWQKIISTNAKNSWVLHKKYANESKHNKKKNYNNIQILYNYWAMVTY